MAYEHSGCFAWQRRNKPTKQASCGERARELSDDKGRHVGWPDTSETVCRGASKRNRRICERSGRCEPVCSRDVRSHSKGHGRAANPDAFPYNTKQARGGDELTKHL